MLSPPDHLLIKSKPWVKHSQVESLKGELDIPMEDLILTDTLWVLYPEGFLKVSMPFSTESRHPQQAGRCTVSGRYPQGTTMVCAPFAYILSGIRDEPKER